MQILDEKFRSHKSKYIIQSIMGGLAVAAALMLFDVVSHPVIIASFGASGFIAFTTPKQKMAQPRCLIGGYVIGIIVGGLAHYITVLHLQNYMVDKGLHIFASGIAVAIAIFLMAITNTEHAPAAGIALGLVLNEWAPLITVKIMAGILVIVIIHKALKNWMIDLVDLRGGGG